MRSLLAIALFLTTGCVQEYPGPDDDDSLVERAGRDDREAEGEAPRRGQPWSGPETPELRDKAGLTEDPTPEDVPPGTREPVPSWDEEE